MLDDCSVVSHLLHMIAFARLGPTKSLSFDALLRVLLRHVSEGWPVLGLDDMLLCIQD